MMCIAKRSIDKRIFVGYEESWQSRGGAMRHTIRLTSSMACPKDVAWKPVWIMESIMLSRSRPWQKSQPLMVGVSAGTSPEAPSTACAAEWHQLKAQLRANTSGSVCAVGSVGYLSGHRRHFAESIGSCRLMHVGLQQQKLRRSIKAKP